MALSDESDSRIIEELRWSLVRALALELLLVHHQAQEITLRTAFGSSFGSSWLDEALANL
jgi:hypothetical protein